MAHDALTILNENISIGSLSLDVDDELSIMRATMSISPSKILLINIPDIIDIPYTHLSLDWPNIEETNIPITYSNIPDGTTHIIIYINEYIYIIIFYKECIKI